jgi:hypothetical protein
MSRPTYALQLPIIILLLLAAAATDERPQLPITRPGCRDKCGNISIPFPFGMEPGCFRPGFQVYCDDHSRAFLHNSTGAYISGGGRAPLLGPRLMESNKSKSLVELFDISIDKNEARGYGAISSYCFVGPGNESIDDRPMKIHGTQLSPAGWPFVLPRKRNVVVGVGGAVEAGPVGGLYGRHTRRWLVGSLLLWVRRDVCSYAMVVDAQEISKGRPLRDQLRPREYFVPCGRPAATSGLRVRQRQQHLCRQKQQLHSRLCLPVQGVYITRATLTSLMDAKVTLLVRIFYL